jgi:retron-type reverse transcriptase
MQRKKGSYPLNQSPLFKLSTKRKLVDLLGLTVPKLRSLRVSAHLYSECEIPKKSGGTRLIENPRRDLKQVQARLARLLSRIAPPDYLFCPVKGRSYVSNAARHLNHRVVRTLDIKKYFPSTPRRRIYKFFLEIMHCNPDVADAIADLATYKGHLPTGSPLSPIMAFYAYYDVWEKVYQIVSTAGATNSLYIDDLTVSGEKVPDWLIWKIKKVIHRSGLRYHKEKTFRDRPAEITGVIVRDGTLVPPNRQLLKKYRARTGLRSATTETQQQLLANLLRGLDGQLSQITTYRTRPEDT